MRIDCSNSHSLALGVAKVVFYILPETGCRFIPVLL